MVGLPSDGFARVLRRHRERARLSQEELAERAGLSVEAISALERGVRRQPRRETVRRLAEALGLSRAERDAFLDARRSGAFSTDPDESVPPLRVLPPVASDHATAARVGVRRPLSNFPSALTSFIGREAQRAEVARLLRTERLVTLTGTGGIGKTRLALAAAEASVDAFADGVRFVPLVVVTDPAQVLGAIAQALEVRGSVRLPLAKVLANVLRERRILLVLDNFEHVVAAAADVAALVAACPRLTVLVTSRERLRVAAEREYPVPALPLPDPRRPLPLAELAANDAIRLLVARTREACPGFRLTAENAPSLVGICTRLDGLPLALELAAARQRLLAPAALLGRLEHRLPLLTGGPRDAPAHQRTVRATIAWSYDLLSPSERRLFRRLGVFADGWTIEEQEAVCAPDEGADSLAALESLLDKSLVRRDEGAGGEPRFRMLETIREFALEQLEASGERFDAQRRHATYFGDLAERAADEVVGPDDLAWHRRMDADHANLKAALSWCASPAAEAAEGDAMGLRIVAGLGFYWTVTEAHRDLSRWLDLFLGRTAGRLGPATDLARAKALVWSAYLAWDRGDRDVGAERHRQAIATWPVGRKDWVLVFSLAMLQFDLTIRGDFAAASAMGAQALALARGLNDPWAIGYVYGTHGDQCRARGDNGGATAAFAESLKWYERAGSRLFRSIGIYYVGVAHLDRDELAEADRLFRRALPLARQFRARYAYKGYVVSLLEVAARRGLAARAVRLAAWVERDSCDLGMGLQPQVRAELERGLALARARLEPAAYAAARAEGEAMTLEQAMDYALEADRD